MRITAHQPDTVDWVAVHHVAQAARSVGRPWFEMTSAAELAESLSHPSPGERLLLWLAHDDTDQPVGLASAWLTDDDNTDKGWLELDVHPVARGRGVGTALLNTIVEACRADGRTSLVIEHDLPIDSTARAQRTRGRVEGFFARAGFTVAGTDTVRHLRLPVPPDALDHAQPSGVTGYRILPILGPIPDDLRASYCALVNRLPVDAPTGAVDWEPESLTPEKLAHAEQIDQRVGRRRLTCLAVAEGTGQVVAYTEILLPVSTPREARQEGTLVHAEHRGHGLGMAVKVANLRALAQLEPTREFVSTGNADDNPWMVAINEALGFRPVEACIAFHRSLDDRREWPS